MANKQIVFYGPGDRPPIFLMFFSALQHMFLVISMGLTLPITISRSLGLSAFEASIFLSTSLLIIGISGIFQIFPTKYTGTGRMDLAVSESGAVSACVYAANLGGMPLVLGMTAFTGVLKFILGSFIYRFRKLFPPEVTGTMIFILSISIIPTAAKFFLGTEIYKQTGEFSSTHLFVATITLLVMLCCTIFSSKLKSYAMLLGIIAGFILSVCMGIFDFSQLTPLSHTPFFRLPLPEQIQYSFDWRAVVPFALLSILGVVDNIGDFTATQKISNPNYKRPDWHSIQNGVRTSGVGNVLSGLCGGVLQSTATANIGISGATGVTSRIVGYITCGLLILLAFFPRLIGVLMLIPEPVLGAMLVFGVTFIMAGGFSALSVVEIDERRMFVIFTSIFFSIASQIPYLWVFVPEKLAHIVLSPLVMGTGSLLFMSLLTNLGTSHRAKIQSGTNAASIPKLNDKIKKICQEWCVSKNLCNSLMFGLDAVAESLFVNGVNSEFQVDLIYDRMQIKVTLTVEDPNIPDPKKQLPTAFDELGLALRMLKNRFDNVSIEKRGAKLTLTIDADI